MLDLPIASRDQGIISACKTWHVVALATGFLISLTARQRINPSSTPPVRASKCAPRRRHAYGVGLGTVGGNCSRQSLPTALIFVTLNRAPPAPASSSTRTTAPTSAGRTACAPPARPPATAYSICTGLRRLDAASARGSSTRTTSTGQRRQHPAPPARARLLDLHRPAPPGRRQRGQQLHQDDEHRPAPAAPPCAPPARPPATTRARLPRSAPACAAWTPPARPAAPPGRRAPGQRRQHRLARRLRGHRPLPRSAPACAAWTPPARASSWSDEHRPAPAAACAPPARPPATTRARLLSICTGLRRLDERGRSSARTTSTGQRRQRPPCAPPARPPAAARARLLDLHRPAPPGRRQRGQQDDEHRPAPAAPPCAPPARPPAAARARLLDLHRPAPPGRRQRRPRPPPGRRAPASAARRLRAPPAPRPGFRRNPAVFNPSCCSDW